MDGEEDDLDDHKDRCRLCLVLFTESDVFYEISDTIIERFGALTSVELQHHEALSSMICMSCNRNLGKFISLRDDLIRKQQKLYNFVFGKDEANETEIQQESDDNEVEPEFQPELKLLPDPEYLNEDTADMMLETVDNECYEEQSDLSDVGEYEYTIIPESSRSLVKYENSTKKRPKAWNWTTEMELDLIRYRRRWKNDETSDNSVFAKISKKFETKGYPKISGKSIKYKYEKLLLDTDHLCKLQSEAFVNPVESGDELNNDIINKSTRKSLRTRGKKTYSVWSQEKEVILLYHLFKIKQHQPAISDNQMLKIVLKEMKCEGFKNITEHIIQYHLKKIRQDNEKHEHLMLMASDLQTQRQTEENLSRVVDWTASADSVLLMHKENLDSKSPALKPSEMWPRIKQQLEFDGHGPFTELDVRNRFNILMRNKLTEIEIMDSIEDSEAKAESSNESKDEHKSGAKRRYLYWTEEMKRSLIRHRNDLKEQVAARELWPMVAQQMEIDGFGTFTPQNVMYKYFNLKRRKVDPSTDQFSDHSSNVDED